ncbi:MAG: MBL fold metallo-hydrolase [Chloroflexi bacterium]|nr:MBL fold metallo-hydrolase [Chloroflexota bacterium]
MVLSRVESFLHRVTCEIVPNVHQISFRNVNITIIAEKELTIIDTGYRGYSSLIADFIRSLGRSLAETSLIIISHNYLDHSGGLAELRKLTRAKVAVHKADITVGGAQPPGKRGSLAVAFRSALYVKSIEVDIQLEGGEVLAPLGGLEVIHTPGHTPGSISLYSRKYKLLFVADALRRLERSVGLPSRLASSDWKQALESIKRLALLDFDILCFGHGPPLSRGAHARLLRLAEKLSRKL